VAYIECATPHEDLAAKGSIVRVKRGVTGNVDINASYGGEWNACPSTSLEWLLGFCRRVACDSSE
jgi:hypothetical protein